MPPAERWQDARRILAVRLDNIGDMVMLGPSLRTLRQALPEASLTLLASPNGSQVAPLLPWVDGVIVHRASWQDLGGSIPRSRERELALADKLAARRFDAAVIFTSFTQSPWPPAYLCHLAGIPLRLGQSHEFGGAILSDCVKPPPLDGHQVDRNLHLLEGVGFNPAGRHLELRIPSHAAARAGNLLRERGIDPDAAFIAVAPGASCPTRRYDSGRFAETLRLLRAESGLPAVVLGGPKEMELCERVAKPAGAPSLAGATDVPEMAAVIARSRLLLANDSGPMHIADALDRPMVILFSGTEYESQWRPRRAPAVLLRRPTACSPCFGFTCPYGMECLDIPAREVADQAMKMLARASRRALDPTDEPRKGTIDHAST